MSEPSAPPAPIEQLADHLRSLYGDARVGHLLETIAGLESQYRTQIPPLLARPGRSPLSERDAILIVYPDQLHEPGLMPLASLAGFAEKYLRGRVSGLHLLPFYPSSSDDGFAVRDYREVEPAFGRWSDIEGLGGEFDLMFDAVFNHLSAGSDWFQRFLRGEPGFEDFFLRVEGEPDLSAVVRPRALPLVTRFDTAQGPIKVWTTFSADQVDLNFANPEVLVAIIGVLLFYAARGARFIRLDAIAFLWKKIGTPCLHLPETHRVIKILRLILDRVAPGLMLITETNVPHADNISYFGNGMDEAQLVYNFALPPLVLHSIAVGNAETLALWAKTLSLPSDEVTFFNFLASHDGIGLNPARGILAEHEIQRLVDRTLAHGGFISEKALPDGTRAPYEMNINYFDALSNPASEEALEIQIARAVCAHGIMLCLPGVPGIYFHSLVGSRGDRAGAESSGIPRRINREKLGRLPLEEALADSGSLRARLFGALTQLLGARARHSAFAPSGGFEVLGVEPRVFGLARKSRGAKGRKADGAELMETIYCFHNVSSEPVSLDLSRIGGGSSSRRWKSILPPTTGMAASPFAKNGKLELAAYAIAWGALSKE